MRVFPDFVTHSVCAWLIEQARPSLKRALIYDPVGGKDIADHMRTNSAAGFDLMHADLVQAAVQWRMSTAVGVPVAHMEGPTVLHYGVGEQITNHYDFVNPRIPNYQSEIDRRGQRIVTFLVYLNDDYEGGETDFPEPGAALSRREGQRHLLHECPAERRSGPAHGARRLAAERQRKVADVAVHPQSRRARRARGEPSLSP